MTAFYLTFYVLVLGVCFYFIQSCQQTPFIDEIFHIPQAQKYCKGLFNEWDPKITTLPGLYLLSLLFQPLFVPVFGEFCSTASLRCCNLLYNIINLLILYKLHGSIQNEEERDNKKKNKKVKPKDNGDQNLQEQEPVLPINQDQEKEAFVISFYPLLFFYSFLFYTDPGSVMFVLMAYLACVKGNHKLSAVLGLLAIVFRQTNVIWVFFFAGIVAAKKLHFSEIEKVKTSTDIKDKIAKFFVGVLGSALRYLLVIQNLIDIVFLIWPYIFVIFSFICFVYWNEGITVGDRTNHVASFHAEQIFYFVGFSLFFASPLLISYQKVKKFISVVSKNPFIFLMISCFCAGLITLHNHVHPFLLADNRHYTFYLWKWLLGRKFIRIMLIPVYLYAIWSMNDLLNVAKKSELWKLVFVVCCVASMVPQLLLEPRYFIIPYLIFRINVKAPNNFALFCEFLLYIAVNAFTVVVFVNKTFYWDAIPEPQRIIW